MGLLFSELKNYDSAIVVMCCFKANVLLRDNCEGEAQSDTLGIGNEFVVLIVDDG